MSKVIVIGSLNIDLVITTDDLPRVGQTILGDGLNYFVGGKGANQAVASNRMGTKTVLLGKIGEDVFGDTIQTTLLKEKNLIDKTCKNANESTGVATVFKLPIDNSIVVVSGANSRTDVEYVKEYLDLFQEGDILLCQLEIPIDTVSYVFRQAKSRGMITLLNPAPYVENLSEILRSADVITPNETEFIELIKTIKISDDNLFNQIKKVEEKYKLRVLITRGEKGVSYREDEKLVTIPVTPVEVVDTTGAGDTFNGVFASCLSKGYSFEESVRRSSLAATLSTTKFGAQTGMPTLDDLENFFLVNNIDFK